MLWIVVVCVMRVVILGDCCLACTLRVQGGVMKMEKLNNTEQQKDKKLGGREEKW